MLGLGFFWEYSSLPDKNFHFSLFNVPYGEGILLETPLGYKIAIDGGIDGSVVAKIAKKQGFFSRKIDGLILSHPNNDHLIGAYAILQNFSVDKIFIPATNEEEKGAYRDFLNLAREKNTEIVYLNDSKALRTKNVYFEVLNPQKDIIEKNDNNSSVGLIISVFGKKIFTGGDMEKEAEKRLSLSDLSLDVDLLKVSHHGSSSSSSEDFLGALSANFAIISAGEKNPFNHPNQEVVKRLKNPLITKKNGDIEYIVSPEKSFIKYEYQ